MGGLFVSGRYRVSDRFRGNMLNAGFLITFYKSIGIVLWLVF